MDLLLPFCNKNGDMCCSPDKDGSGRVSVETGVKTKGDDENRFDEASRYAQYLESPEGRLRTELTLANVLDVLPAAGAKSLQVLDLGCGTGAASIRLARSGAEVTLLDSSTAMLEIAKQAVVEGGVEDKVTMKQGDASEVAEMFPAATFNAVLCHNVLEYVDDPGAVLRGVAKVMRDGPAILSVLVRNQVGEVMKSALQGDLAAAERNLDAEWGQESLYGGKVRLFTFHELAMMLRDASLTVTARRGVRVLSDYLPTTISRSADYKRILALERRLAARPEFFGIARYLHCMATHVTRELQEGD